LILLFRIIILNKIIF